MFRKRKTIVLVIIFGLFFLGINTKSAKAQAQPDNFPIGMYLEYDVYFDSATAGLDYQFRIHHEISEWIDYEQLIVRYARNGSSRNEYFTDIRFGGPDHPCMWMDVSTWQLHDYFLINGMLYEFTTIRNISIAHLGSLECFRLDKETVNDGITSTASLWYHGRLGILLDCLHVDENSVEGWVETYNQTILGSNLDEFNPPIFTDPEPPTTITSVTPTTTTTSPTTRPPAVTIQITPEQGLVIILVVGIIIEIPLLILIIRKPD